MNIWPDVCSNLLIPLSDIVLGNNVKKDLNFLRKFQKFSADEIRQYQDIRFRELVACLFDSVPYYSIYFQKHKLEKSDFTSISDIKKLPILTKQIIKEHQPNLLVNNFRGRKYSMKSSGSTGTQTEVLIDRTINSQVMASQLLFWEWGGFKMGMPHLQTGMSLNRNVIKKLKDILFRCYYVSAFGLDDKSLQKILMILKNNNIKYLFGYASSIYLIATFCKNRNYKIKLDKIFTWGDCLYPNYRIRIEKVFEASVHDCYGLGEGLQIAAQCQFTESLHINQSQVFVEITDPLGKTDCSLGKLGKLLVTRFNAGPMPLVRYDTGDLSSFVDKECKCGRHLQSLSRVYGRDTDIIISPLGDRLIVHFFTQIFEMMPDIEQFQVRQDKLEELVILYVPGLNCHVKVLQSIEKKIHDNCKYRFNIIFIKKKRIPLLKSNKRRFIISNVDTALF